MSDKVQLNFLQRGSLQKVVTFLVYLLCAMVFGFFLDTLEKSRFIVAIQEATSQGVVTEEAFQALRLAILNKDIVEIIYIIAIGIACFLLGWLLMRWSGKLNWAWAVTLPKAIEFRTAMEDLGIADPDDRIDFIRKHKIPVFIASSSLVGREEDTIHARLYTFAHHPSLGEKNVFERHIGKQTLCLDEYDFKQIAEKHGQKTNVAYSVRITTMERDIEALTATNSLHVATMAKLKDEKENLLAENTELRRKLRTVPARQENRKSVKTTECHSGVWLVPW